jgi:hypothetical protein
MELRGECNGLRNEIQQRMSQLPNMNEMTALFLREYIKCTIVQDLIAKENSISFYKRLLVRKHPKLQKKSRGYSPEDIENARNVSIIEIAQHSISGLKKSGKNYFCQCPFHKDKTPSFFLYSDSNRFYCFGCHATGDVITFVQKFFNKNFKDTIYFLIHK